MKKVLQLFFFLTMIFGYNTMVAAPGLGGSNTLLFMRNHVSIESGFTVLRIKPLTEVGQGKMTLSHRPGMYLGFKYHINLSNYFSIRFGPNVGLHAFRYDFEPGTNDTINYDPVRLSVVKPYLSVPVALNARVLVKQRHVLGVVAAVSANLYATERLTANTSLGGDPNGPEVYTLRLAYQKPNPFIALETGIEYSRVLNCMDLVMFSIKYHAGFRRMFYASYTHLDNDLVLSSGSFTSYNDFLSLSVGYVFTRVNKLLDR